MLKDKIYVMLITLTIMSGAVLRFWKINQIPSGSEIVTSQRLLAAAMGTLTVLLLNIVVLLWIKNIKLSLLVSFVYALLPLAIMESRIVSYVTLAVFMYLIGLLMWFQKNYLMRLGTIFFVIISTILVIFNLPYLHTNPFNISRNLVSNIFDAISFTTIFFENDTYWEGGFRNWGMVYPELIVAFLIGLYVTIKNKWFVPLLYFSGIVLLAALNPFYPEAREIGLISPVLAFIIGAGLYSFTNNISKKSTLNIKDTFPKFVSWLYILILLYGISNFLHYYFIHYNLRVVQEKIYLENNF